MRGARTRLLAFASALAAAAGAAALLPAAGSASLPHPKDLWATVNLCDTQQHPDMMGVRASMPGDGDHTRMYMRFVAQYYDRSKQLWYDVKGNGVSKWIFVGSGVFRRRQGGYTFAFDTPGLGQKFVLRGAVDFKWMKKGRIVRSAHLVTKGGHPNTLGADPKTYSAATCQIT
jgi:hypothetical protein